jgi:hypothetical protein
LPKEYITAEFRKTFVAQKRGTASRAGWFAGTGCMFPKDRAPTQTALCCFPSSEKSSTKIDPRTF